METEKYTQHESQEHEYFMSQRVVIKIGSSTLTGGTETVDEAFMASIAHQANRLYQSGMKMFFVTSGAIACGKKYIRNFDGGKVHKQLAAAAGQPELMTRWKEAFSTYDIPILQFLLTQETLPQAAELLSSIEHGIPIINANDAVNSYEIGRYDVCADNDTLAGHIAVSVQADTVFLLTDTCVRDTNGENVPYIHPDEIWQNRIQFNGSSELGTGGMASKHGVALNLAQANIRTIIGNGRDENILIQGAKGKATGTTYIPFKAHIINQQIERN